VWGFEMSLTEQNPLFSAVAQIVYDARKHSSAAVNTILLATYWQIGQLICEDERQGDKRALYGKGLLKELARDLTREFGRGFDERNLNNMRAFYRAFPIWNAVRTELSWTHYRLLSRIEDESKRCFYLSQSIEAGWNSRTLERNISALYFDRRLPDASAVSKETAQSIKDPYIFEFLGLTQSARHHERVIESALIDHLQSFLLELGKGFAFVARQQHIVTDTSDFFIDLVFYNYHLKCFVLIDLKTNKLTHQDIGQMDMYVRMYEDLKKGPDDNPTIGLILCTEKDETVVKYSVLAENKNLFASKYLLYLPKEEELIRLIDEDRERFALGAESEMDEE
jgi:predicted nuclease of restriction endonuclease-like (RecB) superfamily